MEHQNRPSPYKKGAQGKKTKSALREWTEALIFAIIAASIIRWLLLEPFTIPTSSMEKSLMVGDFLFVSKVNYGARTPQTLLSFPLTHSTFPLTSTQSYLSWIQLPYGRIPGFEDVDNDEVVVFNNPAPDQRDRPVDKREHYIKRCVGIAGDTIEINNRDIFINGEEFENHAKTQFRHFVETEGRGISREFLEKHDITEAQSVGNEPGRYRMHLTDGQVEALKQLDHVENVEPEHREDGQFNPEVFPGYLGLPWNEDHFGPLYIPAAGDTIPMNVENYHIYEDAIKDHENNPSLALEDGEVYLKGEQIDEYVFEMDYYFMIGDNRHNSLDSRNWGFVPENHVVGKGWFVWLSMDRHWGGVRWERFFKGIN